MTGNPTHVLAVAALLLLTAVPPAGAGEAEWKQYQDQADGYFRQGNYEQSELLARAALKEAESLPASDQRMSERSLASLYAALRFQEKLDDALPIVRRLVDLRTKQYGPDDVSTAMAIHGNAEILLIQQKVSDAEKLQRRALVVFEKKLGETHFNTAAALHNLGTMLTLQKKYKDGETYLRRALAAKEKGLKPGHMSIVHTLDQLATNLDAQGRQIEAEGLRKRAAGIKQRAQAGKT